MSSSGAAPSLPRQYRCERHPQIEDPYRCSTCSYNRLQRQLDYECGESARAVIDQANEDYISASRYWNQQQQDLTRSRSNHYGELRSTARDPIYVCSGGSGESYYRNYRDTGYGGTYPTRSISFRDPFASSRYGEINRYGDPYGNLRYDNSDNGSQANLGPAYKNPVLDSTESRDRRNAVSGDSSGGQSTPQTPQQQKHYS